MENASKALIIAGAILLSIAIIGIGMTVFNMAQGTIQSTNMSADEIAASNAKFSKYEGLQTGSTVRTMLDTIRTHNLSEADDDSKKICVHTGAATDPADATSKTEATEIATQKGNVKAGVRYKVSFGYTSTGLIKDIGYEEQ